MKARTFPKPFYLVGLMAAFALAGGPLLSAGQDDNSAVVKSRIEEKFKQQGLLPGNDIQVNVENKTVTLSGSVRTLAVKGLAGRSAQSIAEGFEIANDLAMVNPGLSPRQIAERIMAAIEESPAYFIFDYIDVGVTTEGVATLKGWTSHSWSAIEFVKVAESQPGVTRVENEIKRVLTTGSDRTLRIQVAQLIYTLPIGRRFSRMNGHVHILVNNGVVSLGGIVDKPSDKDSFERLVRSNTGASSVINMLQVKKK
jgi:osmotically-inducible protein OsmY